MWEFLGYLFLLVLIPCLVVWFVFPALIVQVGLRISIYMVGLTPKTICVGDCTWCYAERGKRRPDKPSILLLHGFTSSKEVWSRTVKFLPRDIHIIAPDLPGHGGTSSCTQDKMSFMSQAHAIHEFVQAIGLDKARVHVAGQSMGGAISGCYAASFPDHVAYCTLICPAMKTPELSLHTQQMATGRVPLLADSVDEMASMLKLAGNKEVYVPRQIIKGMVQARKAKLPFYKTLFGELRNETNREVLINNMSKITMPSQVLWGTHDKLVHVSGADVLKAGIPNCVRIEILPQCGHIINVEKPRLLAKLLISLQDF